MEVRFHVDIFMGIGCFHDDCCWKAYSYRNIRKARADDDNLVMDGVSMINGLECKIACNSSKVWTILNIFLIIHAYGYTMMGIDQGLFSPCESNLAFSRFRTCWILRIFCSEPERKRELLLGNLRAMASLIVLSDSLSSQIMLLLEWHWLLLTWYVPF